MSESALRLKGRIGALKPVAAIVLIFLFIFLVPVFDGLRIALKNQSGLQAVSVAQLVSGEVDEKSYVSVSGLAVYQLAYTETEDNVTKALIYPLIANNSEDLIFVRTTDTQLADAQDAQVTVTGLTISPPTELRNAIQEDLADIQAAGLRTNTTLYVEEGRKPGQVLVYLLLLAGMAFLGFLGAVTFFFPSVVFHPYPVQAVPQGADMTGAIKATGKFRQVKKLQPLEFGRSHQKFQHAIANLITSEGKYIGVYIHFVYTQRAYGIRVYKQETDWMVIVKPEQVIALDPGRIYAWRDQWAISLKYRTEDNREEQLYIHFDNGAAQADFVNYLRGLGYPVSSGQYATGNVEPTWR